jgi:surfactin synthase thioesterase subunit
VNPFVRPRPVARPALRLVGFHHAGGSSAVYYPLCRSLPADWDLLLLDLPGRGKRHAQQPLDGMDEVVARAVDDLEPWLDSPIALFGHSFGGLLAAEVGRRLEARGVRPVWTGISGRPAPAFHTRMGRGLHEFDDDRLLSWLLSLGGTPPQVRRQPVLMRRLLQVTRADLRAIETWTPDPGRRRLGCPVTVFGGTEDASAPPETVAGWTEETTGDFRQRFYPGGHFFFLGAAFADFARDVIAEALFAAATARPAPAAASTVSAEPVPVAAMVSATSAAAPEAVAVPATRESL